MNEEEKEERCEKCGELPTFRYEVEGDNIIKTNKRHELESRNGKKVCRRCMDINEEVKIEKYKSSNLSIASEKHAIEKLNFTDEERKRISEIMKELGLTLSFREILHYVTTGRFKTMEIYRKYLSVIDSGFFEPHIGKIRKG